MRCRLLSLRLLFPCGKSAVSSLRVITTLWERSLETTALPSQFFFQFILFFCVFFWILNTGNYSVQNHNSFIMYMCDYLPYYQQCERYRYTDMFFLIVIHVILLCPPRVWFFSPGHARSSTSWNEHYCLSCLKYRSLKAESYFSFHYISHTFCC
jgi:hypothetical protein